MPLKSVYDEEEDQNLAATPEEELASSSFIPTNATDLSDKELLNAYLQNISRREKAAQAAEEERRSSALGYNIGRAGQTIAEGISGVPSTSTYFKNQLANLKEQADAELKGRSLSDQNDRELIKSYIRANALK